MLKKVPTLIKNFSEFPIYKFTKRKYAEQLKANGVLRLSTLHEFQDQKIYGDMQSDKSEGFISPVHDRSVPPEGMHGTWHTTLCLNQWMFCATKDPDIVLGEGFNYDCRMEITSPKFFEAITNAMGGRIVAACIQEVEYYDKRYPYYGAPDMFAGFTKDILYKSQEEVRCFWEPAGQKYSKIKFPTGGFNSYELWNTPYAQEYFRHENARVQPMPISVLAARDYVGEIIDVSPPIKKEKVYVVCSNLNCTKMICNEDAVCEYCHTPNIERIV